MAAKKRAPKRAPKKPREPKKRKPAIPKKRKPAIPKKRKPAIPKKRKPAKKSPKQKQRDKIVNDIRKNLSELGSEDFRDIFEDMIRRRQDDLFAHFVELPVKGLDGLLIDEEIEVLQRLRDSYSDSGSIDDEAARVAEQYGVEIREVYTFWIYNGVAA